jgi:hypothetical protein
MPFLPRLLLITAFACAVPLLAACARESQVDMFYAVDGFGTQLLRGEETVSLAEAQSVVGQPYYIGGQDGALGSARVTAIEGTGCNEPEFTLVLATTAPRHLFVAYKDPVQFVPLARWPTAYGALAPQIEPVVRRDGGLGTVVIDQIWRFKAPGIRGYRFIAVAHSVRDLEYPGFGQPGDFDGIFMFKEDAGEVSLLAHRSTVVESADGFRVLPFPFAAAIDPKDHRLELFVYFSYYEGEKVVGYDVSAGRLSERTQASCSL